MTGDLHEYARIGLVHHMLYPDALLDPAAHEHTLAEFATRQDIETFDCCLPYGEERQQRLAQVIRNAGKHDIAFAMHLFPLRKIALCTPIPYEQAQARLIVADMVAQAAAIGAGGFIFASGGPPPAEATSAHREAFASFCRWLCSRLRPHGIVAMLEPFDTTIDKKFLYGSTRDCVALIESLRPATDNLGIELDTAHLPLMGESFEAAIRTSAPYLRRLHLGNCVLKSPAHPRYGDTHPPIGFEPGEIDTPELARILRALLEIGYLDQKKRGALVLEMTPWPGRTVEATIADSLARLDKAWTLA